MCIRIRSLTILLVIGLAALAVLVGCSAPSNDSTPAASAAPGASLDKGGQEEFGPYELVENWPQPLEDSPDGVKHEGWTWGSVGAVFAETPDRVSNGNDDGSTPTCDPEPKRGWERRYHHVIFVVDRNGKMVQWWQDLDKIFDMKCGRGPHKIKMSPYDPEKHVWIIDDQLHMIYKFTYDGKMVMSLGTKGQKGRDGGKLFDRPTDIAWLPDGTFFISDGYGGTRVAKFDKDG